MDDALLPEDLLSLSFPEGRQSLRAETEPFLRAARSKKKSMALWSSVDRIYTYGVLPVFPPSGAREPLCFVLLERKTHLLFRVGNVGVHLGDEAGLTWEDGRAPLKLPTGSFVNTTLVESAESSPGLLHALMWTLSSSSQRPSFWNRSTRPTRRRTLRRCSRLTHIQAHTSKSHPMKA